MTDAYELCLQNGNSILSPLWEKLDSLLVVVAQLSMYIPNSDPATHRFGLSPAGPCVDAVRQSLPLSAALQPPTLALTHAEQNAVTA